ncbi:MAG: DUF2780 domain-containing protein [Pseudomonadales bacterium]
MYLRFQTLSVALVAWLVATASMAQLGGLLDQAKSLGSDSLTQLIGQQVSADESQIEGGLGSLMSLAGSQLSGDDFAKITSAIPGVDKYLDAAKSLGVLDSPITSLEGLKAALGRIGMSPDTITRFLPAAVGALGQIGGPEVAGLLSKLTTG